LLRSRTHDPAPGDGILLPLHPIPDLEYLGLPVTSVRVNSQSEKEGLLSSALSSPMVSGRLLEAV